MNDPVVFLVDDDPAVLKGLTRLLQSAGWTVAPFASAQAFLEALPPAAMGCLVLDVAMPEMDGLELQRALAQRDHALPIVFLTGHGDIAMGVNAIKYGAADFLTKPVGEQQLIDAVRAAVERCRGAQHIALERASIRRRLATLTPREREVMDLVVTGLLNKQIADMLGTVEKTIKVHRARVMDKMQARSLAELVRLADGAGIEIPGAHPR
ncbi:MAG: response regulator transcription factor [Betaproteobacteria bacterium]